ncbi:AAA family ATPase [Streptomyces sp. CA-181903]|uniref:AAA family ATPase n=1 Tax=Streptomyces sp. CA-181903 TaxID=3240055 RepID=UPI003D8C699D
MPRSRPFTVSCGGKPPHPPKRPAGSPRGGAPSPQSPDGLIQPVRRLRTEGSGAQPQETVKGRDRGTPHHNDPPHETECHRMQHPVGQPLPPAHRPMPLDPATAPVAVLLIGPAGAGKTTAARYWADTRRVPTAHISLDDVREWVRAGFADPRAGWDERSEAQYRLARRTCGFAARNFLANGISCILDDAVFPDRPAVGLGGWKRHIGPGLLPVVLLPGLDVVLERNAERRGNRRLGDEEVARIHGRMAGWYGSGLPIIDNSQHDVATTARLIDEAVARSFATPPAW